MIAHYLINPDMRHNMDILSETYLQYSPNPSRTISKKGKNQKTMRDVPLEDIKARAEDADVTFQLKQHFAPILEQTATKKLFEEIEIPLVAVLADMEREGINLDVPFLKQMTGELDGIKSLEAKIYEAAGEKFNLASPKQLGDILFDKMKIGGAKKENQNRAICHRRRSVVVPGLAKPICAGHSRLAPTRQTAKHLRDGVARTGISQNRTRPYRLYANRGRHRPELEQPEFAEHPHKNRARTANPKSIHCARRKLHARFCRLSQIELRIIAALSGEENMIKAFREKEDIHKSTASKVFNLSLEEVTREHRSHAKTVNFGIIYGVSAFGLSNQTSLSRSESKTSSTLLQHLPEIARLHE
jgi:DNA polymerase-1